MANGKTNGGERASGVPCLKVDTGNLPGKAAFELWQEELIPHWEIKLQESGQERFESAAESYFIGEVMLGKVRTPARRIDRSRYRIARDGLTQYGLQFIIGGRIGRRDGEGVVLARNRGDLFVSDLTQTQALEASNLSVLYFSAHAICWRRSLCSRTIIISASSRGTITSWPCWAIIWLRFTSLPRIWTLPKPRPG